MVPLRGIFESLGAKVEWNQQKQTVKATLNNTVIELKINSTNAIVNGKTVKIDVAAKIVNNRTLVPLRFISESLGATVKYDGTKKQIDIYTNK